MSEPQEKQTLEDTKEALEYYDAREEEERIDSLEEQGDLEEEDDDPNSGEQDTKITDLEGKLQRVEDLFQTYGGVEGAVRALDLVKTSPEYQAVTQRLINGKGGEQEDKEVDDPNIDPALKKAHDVIDKRAEKVLDRKIKQLEAKIESSIKPLSDSFHQTKLETINEKMESIYGKEIYKGVEKEMNGVLKDYPANYLDNPSFKKVDDLFHTALRRAGKAEKFYSKQTQDKIKGKKEKSTGSPGTSGNSEDKLELREVKTINDALYNAELKAKHGVTNRENANSRVRGKKFKSKQ